MPSIPLHSPAPDRSPPDGIPSPLPHLLRTPSGLAILELQGRINMPPPSSDSPFPYTRIGRLEFPMYKSENPKEDTAWMKQVYLYVGKYQRLTGEVKKLAKPLGLMRRRQRLTEGTGTETGTRAEDDAEEMEIAEVVYYKIIFSNRPEPVNGEMDTKD